MPDAELEANAYEHPSSPLLSLAYLVEPYSPATASHDYKYIYLSRRRCELIVQVFRSNYSRIFEYDTMPRAVIVMQQQSSLYLS